MEEKEKENEINNQLSDSQKRIRTLSDKLEENAAETLKEREGREKAEAKASEVERERDFYQGFADVVSTNPLAKDHKDEILSKVKGGYTVEDATFAVLGKAGKLGQPAPKEEISPAGGSAVITPPQNGGQKTIAEMTQAERLVALKEAEARGDISLT